jgi:hypothetical protein
MKKFIVLASLVLSTSAFAATIKITSFTLVRSGDPAAELCGVVSEATEVPTFVRVLVDHRSNRPAVYNAVAGADGKFCMSVITYRGTAEASIFGEVETKEAFLRQ